MVETITSLVSAHPGLTLETLLRAVGTTHADSVYALLVQHVIYVDLHATLLTQPSDVRVFANEEMAKALTIVSTPPATRACDRVGTVSLAVGTTVTWDGRPWTVLQVGATQTVLLSQDGVSAPLSHEAFQDLVACDLITGLPPRAETQAVVERLRQASPRDLAIANSRYTLIAPYLNGRVIAPDHPQRRTIFRFRALWHKAQVSCGWSYLGLLPRPHPGNRRPKLPEATLALIDEFIDQRYETVKQRRALEVYGEYLIACGHRALPPCSYRTFMRRIRLRDRHRQTVKREGRRAAYAVAPFYWFLTPETPRHGDLPFEIGHIDHTELPIELVDSHTGVNLGCPWATFLTDAFSRRILADFLTFDPPSYRSCMMVLRDCIRRWGRLPRTLVVDGGKEFASVYFEALLAAVEVTLKVRPPAKPRFGSVIERTFGTTATQFVYNLAGNRQFRGLPRLVTRAIDPARLAVWTLPEFSRKLHEYAFDVYDTLPHATLGQSPREAFAMGVAMAGARAHLLIPYDDTVRMLTLPTTPRGLAKVVPPHGVKIRYVYYWANDFRDPAIERTMVPVRYDPFDAGTAYAYVKGRWVTCSAEHYTELRGRSERELALAAEELRQRHRQHGRYEDITARRLAEFLTSCEGQELLLAQRRRDAEVRATLALAGDRDMVDPPNGDANHQEVVGDQQPPPRMPSAQLRPYGEYR